MGQISRLGRSDKRQHASGGFHIDILHPGLTLELGDSGVGALGRIDDARITPGTLVRMHLHKDDEILTYLRNGEVMHLDSVGHRERISLSRLMLMGAGHSFQHEEAVLADTGELRVLQIFMRPRSAGLRPLVQFHDFGEASSRNAWRLVAGPSESAPLQVRAQAWVHDVLLSAGLTLDLPAAPVAAAIRLLYVFSGQASFSGARLAGGESVLLDAKAARVTADADCELVLLSTDPAAPVFTGGMFSGNTLAAMPDATRQTVNGGQVR